MISITELDKIGSDERGYTYEYFHERMGRHLVLFRKANTYSGSEYHKGISLGKNPEILILLSGAITVNYKGVQDEAIKSIRINKPCKIEIPAFVWHQVYCHTDATFIDLSSLSENQADTFKDPI